MKKRAFAAFFGATAAFVALSGTAKAYNWKTHQLMVSRAVDVMAYANPTVPIPPTVDPADWSTYLAAVAAAPGKLGLLKSGLNYSNSYLPGAACRASGCDPSSSAYTSVTAGFDRIRQRCGGIIDVTDDLALLADVRLQDLNYEVDRGWGSLESCPFIEPKPDQTAVQWTLGWHGASIDDHLDDVHLWYRPTSALGVGLALATASDVFTLGIGTALLPLICLGNLLFGDGCNLDDSYDLARRANLVDLITGIMPGFGDSTSDDFVGLWHFIDVDGHGDYNDIRGMHYTGAGPGGIPGAVDVGIATWGDVSGLSLNAHSSEGVRHYGKFDRAPRLVTAWQAQTIGHTEFSPVDNLARYGWDNFVASANDASWLGWPLHALGDAAEPHHVVGTTSWGHRPYEEFVDKNRDVLVPGTDAEARLRVLQIGYRYWKVMTDHGMNAAIEAEAQATRDLMRTPGTESTVFRDLLSVNYAIGLRESATDLYLLAAPVMSVALQEGVSAILGVLTYASTLVKDPGPAPKCGQGTYFDGIRCVPGAAPGVVTLPLAPAPAIGIECAPPAVALDGRCVTNPACTEPCDGVNVLCPEYFRCVSGCCQEIIR